MRSHRIDPLPHTHKHLFIVGTCHRDHLIAGFCPLKRQELPAVRTAVTADPTSIGGIIKFNMRK